MDKLILNEGSLGVVNVGLEAFTADLETQGVAVAQVAWKPPLDVDKKAVDIINKHYATLIEKANTEALKIINAGKPVLIGMGLAIDTIPGMHKDLILHAGPPITWDKMCGPMRGAVIGALIYERRASTPEEAEVLAASDEIKFEPCHEHGAVGPMAGIISASMPVFIIKNETYGNLSYATQNEGLGKVLRYGAYSPEVITRLRWMDDVLYPVMSRTIKHLGQIDLQSLIAQALHMGDEVHNRNRAGTSLLIRQLAPALLKTMENVEDTTAVLDFINGNDHFFLNLSMPACKAVLDAARNIPNSSIAVVMARNGTEFGVQLSGTGNKWFTGEALVPDALYFPGYSKADANPDIGDSAITETGGLGGFAIAAAPAIVQFVGGNASDALSYTESMYEICFSESVKYQIPALDFRGTPLGIDVVKVIDNNLVPIIDTGVAHKNPGVGQVGAGVVKAPVEPFIKAYEALAKTFV
ncbi:MAG: hypothetical protein CVU50_10285 [Candidatus Cloacimonetes bacterium HGW-Cloacimonetes-3]|jgi:hypothetical protein|nr:MAG: hypothetical protein CVU50_10285 [Candidatus Cloacimonetes bacterium HGW-Cloacimonetes-3]